jgi:AraC-like DNA-binding protein
VVSEPVAEHAVAAPSPVLAGYVGRMVGYRFAGLPPGVHLGLPSRYLTVVLAFDAPTRMVQLPDPAAAPVDLFALAGGLASSPVSIAHDGAMAGLQIDLTPAGARALLGLPAAELTHSVVDLAAVLGPQAAELNERLALLSGWPQRFAALEAFLLARMRRALPPVPEPVQAAWSLIVASRGARRIGDVADAVGYSRRRLDVLFGREYGLAPKQLARIARFERAVGRLKQDPGAGLAAVAAGCGYADQAHMTRDWRAFAGCPPSRWLEAERDLFVQDDRATAPAACVP